MVKPYSKKIAIARTCTALSNISRTWEECWEALCNGDAIFNNGDEICPNWPQTPPLSMLKERAGWDGNQPEFLHRFSSLMKTIGRDLRPFVDELAARQKDIKLNIIIATCHSDAGPLSTLVNYKAGITSEVAGETYDLLQKTPFPAYIAEGLGRQLPVSIVSSACASALVACSYAADMIDAGLSDAVIIVAQDGMSRVAAAGFHNIGAMTKTVCTPYDVNRTGTTVAEGGVGFVLAREDLLLPEEVYGRLAGTSIYCDAAHIVEPNPEGVRCVLQEALDQAEVPADKVAGIYWHGTGTKHNDKVESVVSDLLFGSSPPPSTSTKGNLGHTMGASGAYNILAACATNQSKKMTHVCSLNELEYPNLDIVRDAPREVKPGPMLVTALGFGGINAAVIVTP